MKLFAAVKCFNALSKIKDKNSITDANIRFAVISNMIALSPLTKLYEDRIKIINAQCTNDLIEEEKQKLGELQQKWQEEKDEAQKKFIELQITDSTTKIDKLLFPFEKTVTRLIKEANDTEQSVTLKVVDLQAFDTATSKVENISVRDFADLSPMFKKDAISEKKKEEKK